MSGPVLQSQAVQIFHGQLVPTATADALVEQRKFHILHGSLETDEVERLEDEPDGTVAVTRCRPFAEAFDEPAVDDVFTLVVGVEDAQYI